jgi:hypothetical protein
MALSIFEVWMATHEKRITTLPPVRCSDTLLAALNELAARDERSLSEYVRRVLERHVWGMAASLPADQEQGK